MPRNRNKSRAGRRVSQRRSMARKTTTSRNAMSGAPVAVSRDLQQYTEFASSGNGIVMKTCAAISEIRRTTSDNLSAAAFGGFANRDEVGNVIQSSAIQMSLTQPLGLLAVATRELNWLSPVFDLIASAFTRYRVRKLVFHYEPQSPATASQRLVFAFAADPAHPVLGREPLTSADCLAVADSIAFMPWKTWSMDVSHRIDTDKLFYTYSPQDSVSPTESRYIVTRFSDFGIMGCVSSSEATTPITGGVLYLEAEIEFIEFCPISVTVPLTLTRLARKAKAHGNNRKREKPTAKLERLRTKRSDITRAIKDLEMELDE